jgi:hypothetical protein
VPDPPRIFSLLPCGVSRVSKATEQITIKLIGLSGLLFLFYVFSDDIPEFLF